jgi:hypothetical protein
MMVPPYYMYNIKDIGNIVRTNGERPRWTTAYICILDSHSKVRCSISRIHSSPAITVYMYLMKKIGLKVHKWGHQDDTKIIKGIRVSRLTLVSHLPSNPLKAAQYTASTLQESNNHAYFGSRTPLPLRIIFIGSASWILHVSCVFPQLFFSRLYSFCNSLMQYDSITMHLGGFSLAGDHLVGRN